MSKGPTERSNTFVVAQQPPARAPLDSTGVLLRVGGDRGLLEELAGVFRENYPRQLSELRKAIIARDPIHVERASHALRGALNSLGAVVATESAMRLEEMARHTDLTGADSERVLLEREIVRADEALFMLCHEVQR